MFGSLLLNRKTLSWKWMEPPGSPMSLPRSRSTAGANTATLAVFPGRGPALGLARKWSRSTPCMSMPRARSAAPVEGDSPVTGGAESGSGRSTMFACPGVSFAGFGEIPRSPPFGLGARLGAGESLEGRLR